MPARGTADTPHPQRSTLRSDIWVHPELGGTYLTDEVFLYRVVSIERDGLDEIAELEDCFGLDIVRVSVRELTARRLRVVTPAPG